MPQGRLGDITLSPSIMDRQALRRWRDEIARRVFAQHHGHDIDETELTRRVMPGLDPGIFFKGGREKCKDEENIP